MKLIIDIPENVYNACNEYKDNILVGILQKILYNTVSNGIPVEEIPNPCIECSQNCCVCELNEENCECQKVYVVKEKNNGT